MRHMLVEPQRDRDGHPTGCTGLTMEDGTVYRASKKGHLEVEDHHFKSIIENPLAPGHVVEAKFHGAGTPGADCGVCGFAGFTFQASRPCPRCGADQWETREVSG